jgi:lycopene cyclase domain-containing protein
MTYTAAAVVGVVASLALDVAVLRTSLVRRKAFWTAYLIVLGFQLVVNGVLTGTHRVTYSPGAILGGRSTPFIGDGRVVFAPVEDLLFGFALVVQTLAWWVWWGRRRPSLNAGAREPLAPMPVERPPRAGRD